MCTIGGVICVATAGLFASTLNAVASGETYVDALKSRSSRGAEAEAEPGGARGWGWRAWATTTGVS